MLYITIEINPDFSFKNGINAGDIVQVYRVLSQPKDVAEGRIVEVRLKHD